MRTPFAVAVVAVGLFVVPATAQAHGRGGGEVYGDFSTAVFSAKGRAIQHSADPRDASGRVAAHPAPPVVNQLLQQGQVICTDVVGNTAGLLMRVDDGTVTGSVFYATAVDNGPGNKDLAGFLPATESSSCAPGLAPTQPVTSGDITVRQY